MNHSTRVIRRSRRAWWRTERTLAAAILTGLALLVAACGGSSTRGVAAATTSGSSSNLRSEALAFARCMRSHGVRNWPDPNSSGLFPKRTSQELGVSSSQFQAAQTACGDLLPNGALPPGGQLTAAGLRKMESDALRFARCMRSHGVSNWPDYTLRGGIPIFDLHGTTINPNASQIVTTQVRCKSQLHLAYSPPTSGGAA